MSDSSTPTTDDDDAELVARCRRGDDSAWPVLVRRYQRLVYAIVLRMGLDEHAAGDVFQTVFARLLEHLPRIREPARLQAWIVTSAKREGLLARSLERRTVSLTPLEDDAPADLHDPVDDALAPDEALDMLQQSHQLRLALERIDERCRALLRLVFSDDDIAYEEIARRMGVPVGSIGPTRARCLGKLRKIVS